MSLLTFIQSAAKRNTLLNVFFFLALACSLTACGGDDDYFKSPCLPSETEKQAQKVLDVKAIKKFLRENNVDTTQMKETASGIHYLPITAGTGAQVTTGKTVQVHYIGKHLCAGLPSTCTFDESYSRQSPFTFTVGARQVIAGWEEALPLMKVGEETRFYIPSYLAYGPCGNSAIGPNEILVFDIKVVKIL
ncbi:FKBP-type peptidyl-prolyl cis-trans isomerase [Pontibacter vulgaris]|uniref:FKBP-type peptidyl-prolyl cis-trans isomerase n=1 Tax=Pontibacter vulgaris TaxID=2905679 RepID=UPI001FA808FD|nr:FKBP-type peptidyl-prolyl cis-trans isomerase [Pontibacter vulgaris]